MGFGLLELSSMTATVLASNGASRRVLEKPACAARPGVFRHGEPKLRYELGRGQWQEGESVSTGADLGGKPGGAAPER